jgi:hypothetical protein
MISTPSGRDRELVIDIPDARGRPGRSFGFVALRPRADVAFQSHLVAIDFNIDIFPIQVGGTPQGSLSPQLNVRRGCRRLDNNQNAHTDYTRQIMNSFFSRRLLKFVINFPFERDPTSFGSSEAGKWPAFL